MSAALGLAAFAMLIVLLVVGDLLLLRYLLEIPLVETPLHVAKTVLELVICAGGIYLVARMRERSATKSPCTDACTPAVYRHVIDGASVWINALDRSARVSVWNRAAERVSGYKREEVVNNDAIWEWLYPDPDYRADVSAKVAAILDRGEEVDGIETRITTRYGDERVISWNSRRLTDKSGMTVGSVAIGRDVTAQRAAERTLVERERQLAMLMSNLPGLAYRCLADRARTMQFVSAGSLQLTGYSPTELVAGRGAEGFAALIHPDDRPKVFAAIESGLLVGGSFAVEYRIRRRNGAHIWVWEKGGPVAFADGVYVEGIIIDISDRKKMEEQLQELATRDSLTGLLNRRETERLIAEEIDRARRYKRSLSLLWLDIDHFKSVNDRFGHRTGDEVLKWVSRLLSESIRQTDFIGRFGGEEIVIGLPEMNLDGAVELSERLRNLVEQQRFRLGDIEVGVTVSIGVSTFPEHARDTASILTLADDAMYRAKNSGRNRVWIARHVDHQAPS